MKYVMNGGLIVGSRDGANLEIEKELGQSNVFLFGSDNHRLHAYNRFVSTSISHPISTAAGEAGGRVAH